MLTEAELKSGRPPVPGRWLLPGVYFAGAGEPSQRERMEAALKWAGEEAALFGPTAAEVWGLRGFEGNAAVHLVLQAVSHVPRTAAFELVLHRKALQPADVQVREGLRVTSAEQTLFDLSGAGSSKKLEWLVDQALKAKLTSPSKLCAFFEREAGRGRKGARAMRALFARRGNGLRHLRSKLEEDFARLFEQERLPPPEHDHKVRGRGGQTYFIDMAYPEQKLAIEVDTYMWHGGDEVTWAEEQTRMNELVSSGWSVMRFTNFDLDRPRKVAGLVRAALRARARPG